MEHLKFILLIVLVAISIACGRKTSSQTQISVSFPDSLITNSKSESTETATATSFAPDHVIINVSGEGVGETIVYSWDSCKDCPGGEKTFPDVFNVGEATTGKSIQVQTLAVYKDASTSQLKFYYGNFASVFNATPIAINVSLVSSSTSAISGRISGRYLTGVDTGPTGTLEMSYDFNTADAFPPLVIERSFIINGWFAVFALTGMPFKYTVANTGLLLWDKAVSLDSDVFDPAYTPDSGATYPQFNRTIKAYIPVHLEEQSSTTRVREAQIFTWGYWGNANSNVSSKRACTPYLSTNTSKAKLYQTAKNYSASTYLTYDRILSGAGIVPTVSELLDDTSDANAEPYLTVQGGANMTGACGSYSSPSDLDLNYFKVLPEYFDGVGNDQATGLRGIFKMQLVNGYSTPVSSSGDPVSLSFNLLPGVADIIGEVAVYSVTSTTNYNIENPKCDGFEGITGLKFVGSATINAGDTAVGVSTAITSTNLSAGTYSVVCFKGRTVPLKHGVTIRTHEMYTPL